MKEKTTKDLKVFLKNTKAKKDGRKCRPYPIKFFRAELRRVVFLRDENKCLFPDEDYCKGALSLHHIDYNKDNCVETNLIVLCLRHNAVVNFRRNYWSSRFSKIIKNIYD